MFFLTVIWSWYFRGFKISMMCFSDKIFSPLRHPQHAILEGRNFKFWQKSKIFNLRWVPKVLPHQIFFFAKNVFWVTWLCRKNLGPCSAIWRPPDTNLCQIAQNGHFSGYPFWTKFWIAGLGVVGAGWNFAKKNLRCYFIFQKQILVQLQKLTEIENSQKDVFFRLQ